MSKVIKLKKGLDIKLNGEAENNQLCVKTDGFPGYDSETSSQGRR